MLEQTSIWPSWEMYVCPYVVVVLLLSHNLKILLRRIHSYREIIIIIIKCLFIDSRLRMYIIHTSVCVAMHNT